MQKVEYSETSEYREKHTRLTTVRDLITNKGK